MASEDSPAAKRAKTEARASAPARPPAAPRPLARLMSPADAEELAPAAHSKKRPRRPRLPGGCGKQLSRRRPRRRHKSYGGGGGQVRRLACCVLPPRTPRTCPVWTLHRMMAESEKEAEKQRLKDMDSKDLRNATAEDKARAAPRADITLAALAAPSPPPAPPRRQHRPAASDVERGCDRAAAALPAAGSAAGPAPLQVGRLLRVSRQQDQEGALSCPPTAPALTAAALPAAPRCCPHRRRPHCSPLLPSLLLPSALTPPALFL